MTKETMVSCPTYGWFPTEIEGFSALAELALDMRWSWNHSADEVWQRLDQALWDATNSPWLILKTVSRDRLLAALGDPGFRKRVEELLEAKHQAAESPTWFQEYHPDGPLNFVAYFSMEFMLSEALPIYSGGLGNVAGDQLKTASDLGVPVVAVGLLYQQGYFRQVIDKNGMQQALFPYNDPWQLPITPLREPNGEWLRLELDLPGYSVWLRAWQVQVGQVKLYLLDSNDPVNFPARRGITSEPRRPWEASGTSGMKVLVNGGINLSELDGWWAEAYTPEVGWALGDGKEHGEDPGWDAAEAEQLYNLLEREVIPEFYARDANGIPSRWITRMRESMAHLTPRFSANRTVREYTEKYYIPAARAYRERAAEKCVMGKKLVNWEHDLKRTWSDVHYGATKVTRDGEKYVFEVQVYLGDLDPNSVKVEIYANAVDSGEPVRQEMVRGRQLVGTNGFVYSARAPSNRPAVDYTARVIPHFEGVAVPLEAALTLWQH